MSSPSTGRPTLRTVAVEAGVSTATVSYVMRGRLENIAPETAARVREAADALGYRPNRSAQAMRTGRSDIVLLSLDMLSDPWSQSIASETARLAEENGKTALIQADGRWWETVERVQPDVTFIDSPDIHPDYRERLAALVGQGHRIIVFSTEAQPAGYHVVDSPSYDGAKLVLEHLLSQTDDIAMVASERMMGFADDDVPFRVHAYTEAVAQGRIRRPWIETFDDTVDGAYGAVLELLRSPDRPRALFAAADFIAIEALRAARVLDIRVPEDLLVTGLGDSPAAGLSVPALTTAGPPGFARQLAELIIDASTADIGDGVRTVLAWELVVRGSSALAG